MDVVLVIDKLANDWIERGLEQDDTILIHSSVKRTIMRYKEIGYDITPDIILDSFLKAVGNLGTVLLPLFDFDFAKGVPFDIRNTPSRMGALTESGRLRPSAVRTGHPIYSFAAIGYNASKFKNVNNYSGYGEDSPFAILRELNGKIAVLDLLDQNSMTFYHHVEEMQNVEYRYHKKFTGQYTDQNGLKSEREYGLFVRNIDRGIKTHVNPTGELLWNNSLYKGDRPNVESGLRIIDANDMYQFVSDIIKSGRAEGLLYKIEKDEK